MAPTMADLASCYFWQIWPNLVLGKFLADLAVWFSRFQHSCSARQLFTSQSNKTRVLACHHLSDFDGSCSSKQKNHQ